MREIYEYDAVIRELPDNGGAYVEFPWDVRREFGKGRAKVRADRERTRPVSASRRCSLTFRRRPAS